MAVALVPAAQWMPFASEYIARSTTIWAGTYLFEPDFCNVAAGWEKGRVEKGVKDARRRIWQDAHGQRFTSFAALNAWLATQCLARCDAPHPELPGVTLREAWPRNGRS